MTQRVDHESIHKPWLLPLVLCGFFLEALKVSVVPPFFVCRQDAADVAESAHLSVHALSEP